MIFRVAASPGAMRQGANPSDSVYYSAWRGEQQQVLSRTTRGRVSTAESDAKVVPRDDARGVAGRPPRRQIAGLSNAGRVQPRDLEAQGRREGEPAEVRR